MRLHQVAGTLTEVGERLDAAGGDLSRVDPGGAAFGADAPGRLGELGRMLHGRWVTALTDRSREAAAHGARLTDTADILDGVLSRYREAEDSAAGRHDLGEG